MSRGLSYHHVDVFATRPYTGNSLAVFSEAGGLTTLQMDRITKELRHFESIFLEPAEESRAFRARVFDLIEFLLADPLAVRYARRKAGHGRWR